MKKLFFLILILAPAFQSEAQQLVCTLKKPAVTIHFGTGDVRDLNTVEPYNYERVASSCPTDGHYTFTSYTSDCFRGDWLTLREDHTPGDVDGNMMLVNASYGGGEFLRTSITGLKTGVIYEFAAWMMNVCKPTEKCPFPLLPNITIRLQTLTGKVVTQLNLGDLPRHQSPRWTQYKAVFTAPASVTSLMLVMVNNAPGGCGNDFAVDDITFRECEKQPPPIVTTPNTTAPKKQPATTKQPTKAPVVASKPATSKPTPKPTPKPTAKPTSKDTTKTVKPLPSSQIAKPQVDTKNYSTAKIKPKPLAFPPPPPKLRSRENAVVKQIETEPGEMRVALYDNGEIDDDTVSIYHNNKLIISNARLSQKPLTFLIVVDAEHPHHELVMVAENLGSIPPNTSLMVITAGTKRYEVFISSTEQKNAKVVFNLKE